MSLPQLVLRYIAFAIVATVGNLAMQRWLMALWADARSYWLALAVGSLTGLAIKYVLDKRWIFADTATGVAAHSQKFALYTTMGVATTIIFWMSETVFWLTFHTQTAREIGAVLGLSVGYFVKYHLDSRFVFASRPGEVA